jgi:hypothetical protein
VYYLARRVKKGGDFFHGVVRYGGEKMVTVRVTAWYVDLSYVQPSGSSRRRRRPETTGGGTLAPYREH